MRRLFTYGLLLFTVLSFAQAKPKKDKEQEKGNTEFGKKNYVEAEADYRISKSNTNKAASAYNLGNAIYRQGQSAEAAYAYLEAIKNARTKQQKHMAYHNLGNIFMKEKNYQMAVEAYKNALRNNPADEESRYNYALAKEMLKNNPPPPQKPPQDKKDKNDQKKDDKQQQPNGGGNDQKDKGDKGDDKNKGGDGDQKDKTDKGKGDQKKDGDKGDPKDDGDNQGKGKPKEEAGPSPSKQRMENLLDAMNNEEKKIQDKVNGRKVRVKPGGSQEKDW